MSAPAETSDSQRDDARALALVTRAESWRPPPRDVDDGPPAPDELLLIVLRSKRSPNTRRL